MAEVVAEIEALVGPDAVAGWDFEAIEMAVRREALRVAARAVEQRINADTSDYVGPTAACPCGKPARYVRRRSKTVISVLGALTLERAYFTASRARPASARATRRWAWRTRGCRLA